MSEEQLSLESAVVLTPLQQRFPRPPVADSEQLVLYYHPHNFFSQKVTVLCVCVCKL